MKRLSILLIALALIGVTAASAQASTWHTRKVHVYPVDSYGFLKKSYHVLHKIYGGNCIRYASEAVHNADRCFIGAGGNRVMDPCWTTLNSHGRYNGDYCLNAPWGHDGILAKAKRTGNYYYPGKQGIWGMKLDSNVGCVWLQGTGSLFHGKRSELCNAGTTSTSSASRTRAARSGESPR